MWLESPTNASSSAHAFTRDLTPIAKQGVLWLNTSLTVQAHKAGSHSRKGWETFTAQVIRVVLQRKGNDQPGVVFMAWGLPAQKTFSTIGIDEVSLIYIFNQSRYSTDIRRKSTYY